MSEAKPPAGVPTIGRIILFQSETLPECPAIVHGYQEDNTDRGGTVHVTAFTVEGPKVEFAPGDEGKEDAGGRKWRWPPRA